MPSLPLTPHLKRYGGSKESLRRKNTEYNLMAQRVADYINKQIAANPNEIQQYFFGDVAAKLGLSVDQVRDAISDGGYNGITIRVQDKDRVTLSLFKR